VRIFVQLPNGKSGTLEAEPTDRVEDAKAKIFSNDEVPPNRLRLLYNGQELAEDGTLQDCGIVDGGALRLEIAPASTWFEYTVQRGDSLWLLARKFGTTVEAIMALNGLTGDMIFVGQVLRIPNEGPPVDPGIPPANRPILRMGSRGELVSELQMLLITWGYYAPAPIDGIFGPLTQNAVMAFQRDQGLAVDGIVGPITWTALLGGGTVTPPPPPPNRPTLRRGSVGNYVQELQLLLSFWSYRPGSIDGIFGPLTQNAVMAFQRDQGLAVDGVVGPITWGALLSGWL